MNSPKSHKKNLRALALGGTALALVMAGGVLGSTYEFVRPTPAYAEPVQVQGVQMPSFADLVQKVSPAVVSVRVKEKQPQLSSSDGQDFPFQFQPGSPMERFFRQFRQMNPNDNNNNNNQQQPQGYSMALGSGFFISADGYLVTNNHVVDKGSSFTVVLEDGTELPAKVIGTDSKTDLALLKVNDPGHTFTYVKFANSAPRVGDWVVAVGNPFGLGGTVTAGIVSAKGRQIGGPYDNYIQIDAPVNRGNSGGPTFNLQGEVIGVNTAIYSPSGGSVGIAFDIPASTVSSIVNDLMKHGSVVRGWLGVQIQTVNQGIADSLGLKQAEGAIVGEVMNGSPAQKAGFKVGDAITEVNGKPVKNSRDLALRISEMNPGTKVTVTYWRGGESHTADVTLGTLPNTQQMASAEQEQCARGAAVDAQGLRPDAQPGCFQAGWRGDLPGGSDRQGGRAGTSGGRRHPVGRCQVGQLAGPGGKDGGRRQGRWPQGGALENQVWQSDAVRCADIRTDLTEARGGSALSSPRDFRFAQTAGRPPGLPFSFLGLYLPTPMIIFPSCASC